MRKKTVFIITIAQLVNYAIPALTFPLLISTFDINTYGLWIVANTVAGFAVIFWAHGLSNALGTIIANRKDDPNPYYANVFYAFLTIGSGMTVAILLAAPMLNAIMMHSAIGTTVLRIVSITAFTMSLNVLAVQVFRLRQKPVIDAILEIAVVLTRFLAVGYAVLVPDLLTFVQVFAVSQVVVTAVQIAVAYRGIPLSRPSGLVIKHLLHYGWNLSTVSLANWLMMYGDRLMLSIFSTSAAVAVYSASYQLGQPLIALGWPYAYTLLPVLAERWKSGDIQGAQQVVRQSTRAMSILLIPATVGLTLIGSALLQLLGGDEFAQGQWLIGMIALGISLDVIGTNLQYIFYAQGRPEVLRRIYGQATLLNLGLNLLAIPLFGFYGAGFVTLLTFVFTLYRLWRQTTMPMAALFDLGVLWRCLLISAVMGVWVAITTAPSVVRVATAIAGGLTIYGAGLLTTRVISLSELAQMRHAVANRFTSP